MDGQTALMVLGPEKGEEVACKFGLAASFVRQSSRLPTISQVADGKIVLSALKHPPSESAWSLVFALVLACFFIAIALFVYRRRQ